MLIQMHPSRWYICLKFSTLKKLKEAFEKKYMQSMFMEINILNFYNHSYKTLSKFKI